MQGSRVSMRVVLAVGFAVVGIGVAVRSLQSTLPAPAPISDAGGPTPIPETDEYLIPSASMTFDTKPTAKTVPKIAKRAAERLRLACRETLSGCEALDEARAESLAARFERHFSIVLSGSYEEWLAQIAEVGGRFEGAPGEPDGQPSKKTFEAQAIGYKLVPVSIRDIKVRPLFLKGKNLGYQQSPIRAGPIIRGPYGAPDPAEAGLDVYEVLVPMLMYVPGKEKKEMNVAFWYEWVPAQQDWIPYGMPSYTDHGGTFALYVF